MSSWHAVVNERGADGKRHFWNITIEADDARDAAEQAATQYDPERVDGIEVERNGTDYNYGR